MPHHSVRCLACYCGEADADSSESVRTLCTQQADGTDACFHVQFSLRINLISIQVRHLAHIASQFTAKLHMSPHLTTTNTQWEGKGRGGQRHITLV